MFKRIKKCLKNKKGFTLVEVLVSIALLGIVLPLTFELFNLGNNLMAKSVQKVESGGEVSYTIDTNGRQLTSGVVDTTTTEVPVSGTIEIVSIYRGSTELPAFRGTTTTVSSYAKKKGDVIYYTYEP